MKVVLAQMEVRAGQCNENFNKIQDAVKAAKEDHADLIVFPELCVSGYLLADKWLDQDFCEFITTFNEKIKALSDGIGIIFGNLYDGEITAIKRGRDGRKPRYNAALFAYNQRWVKKESSFLNGIHIKQLNPDYRIFDDSRYFLSGIEIANRLQIDVSELVAPFLFEKNNQTYRIGLEVCEDMWSNDYSEDVTACYIQQGVDFIINVSSSPWTLHKEQARDKRVKEHASKWKNQMVPLIYVNACGMQNTGKNIVVFDGGSCVYDQHGEGVFYVNDSFEEEYITYDFGRYRALPNNPHKLLDALTYAISSFDQQMFAWKPKWIIGLSGGIDSCINAALLVRALGRNRVIGYNLATQYNSQTTKDNAHQLAKSLGIEIHEGSIEKINEATIETMHMYGYEKNYKSLVYENIQARIRGHLLSTFASIENGVIINNGNKIEVALGYCTLYGDCIGALSPLGDLTKVQCFTLAREINDVFQNEIISKTLIPEMIDDVLHWEMPPSAELKDAQLDPMKWFYHDLLISYLYEYPTGNVCDFMQSYLDGSIYEQPIGKWINYYCLNKPEAFINDLEWLLKTMSNAVFKRIQSPPICIVSRGAFGSDYRESQLGFIKSERYEHLKQAILKKKKH